ncbi:MAG: topoisomerase DNA-binding C4 zinc finger domain-containing protein, partial [Lachnospiraceae bacterium]|nr:topoisomerase DNA-binding C4 zinc finger domain-containing protein [Lachnospiraceae bacterium]
PFIWRDSRLVQGRVPGNDFVDTLPLARLCLPALAHHSMTALAEHFGISTEGAHRALKDCYMTFEVYEKLGPMIAEAVKKIPKCRKCGRPMVRRKGKYGEFWGCSGYPDCTFTKKL